MEAGFTQHPLHSHTLPGRRERTGGVQRVPRGHCQTLRQGWVFSHTHLGAGTGSRAGHWLLLSPAPRARPAPPRRAHLKAKGSASRRSLSLGWPPAPSWFPCCGPAGGRDGGAAGRRGRGRVASQLQREAVGAARPLPRHAADRLAFPVGGGNAASTQPRSGHVQPLRECGRGLGRKGAGQELGGDMGAGPRLKALVDLSRERPAGGWHVGTTGEGLERERLVGVRLVPCIPERDS